MFAGQGTTHPGIGPCNLHGGNAPRLEQGQFRKIAEGMLDQSVRGFGIALPIDPVQALLDLVAEANGAVKFLGDICRVLDKPELLVTYNNFQGEMVKAQLRLYGEWVDRLAKLAKTAIDAGIEERRLRLREREGAALIYTLRKVLSSLHLTPSQRDQAYSLAGDTLRQLAITGPPTQEAESETEGELITTVLGSMIPDSYPRGEYQTVIDAQATAVGAGASSTTRAYRGDPGLVRQIEEWKYERRQK